MILSQRCSTAGALHRTNAAFCLVTGTWRPPNTPSGARFVLSEHPTESCTGPARILWGWIRRSGRCGGAGHRLVPECCMAFSERPHGPSSYPTLPTTFHVSRRRWAWTRRSGRCGSWRRWTATGPGGAPTPGSAPCLPVPWPPWCGVCNAWRPALVRRKADRKKKCNEIL